MHSMWCIKDAPNLNTATGRQVAPQSIDQKISVEIPEESEWELRELVLCLQQHHHTLHANVAECRFDFPRPLYEETRLKSHNDPCKQVKVLPTKEVCRGREYLWRMYYVLSIIT